MTVLRAFLVLMRIHMVVQTKKDPIYAWKALRLTVRESISGLAQAMEPLNRSRPVRGRGVDLEDIVHRLLPVRLLAASPWDEVVLQCDSKMYTHHSKLAQGWLW